MLATAKTVIDQLTEMLRYFTCLGDSGPLRDYREVKANLVRSRALLSAQPDTIAELTEAALRLSKLVDTNAVGTTSTPKMLVTQKPPPARVADAALTKPSEPRKAPAIKPSERSSAVVHASSPRRSPVRQGFFDQTVASAVFSEIEAILGHPTDRK